VIEEVPQTWQIANLGKIAKEFISGGTPSTSEAKFWDGDIPWTTSAPISDTDIFLDRGQRFITSEGLKKSASHLVPEGNLLVGTRVGVGKAVVNSIDIAISQDLTGIILDSSVIPAFIAYQFKTHRVGSFFLGRKRGTTIKGIARLDLQALPLWIPLMRKEQEAIIQALRAMQEAREARQREAALERERKTALMDYLFSHGTQGEPRKQTEIGEIPNSWQAARLGELSKVRYGLGQPPQLDDNGVPMIRATDIKNGKIISHGVLKVKNEAIPKSRSPFLKKGDILVVRSGAYTGDVAMYDGRWDQAIAGYDLVVSPDKEFNSAFLAQYLLGERAQRYFKSQRDRSAQPHLNSEQLGNTLIPLPPHSEQKDIAKALIACDTKIATLEREAALLEELFRAMLEELMTGRLAALALVEGEVKA